jgi:maleate isomerase
MVPSSNTTMELEFNRVAPENVSIHSARMRLKDVTPRALFRMSEAAERAASLLSTADVDVIIYGCTTGSLVGGVEWEEKLVRDLNEMTGIRTISTSIAVVEAIKELGEGFIGLATPYTPDLNRLEIEFFRSKGLKTASVEGLGLVRNVEIGRVRSESVEKMIRSVSRNVDMVFVSCTNLPSINLIDGMERELNKPVVTSNQASLWAALQGFGIKSIEGYGELLREHLIV